MSCVYIVSVFKKFTLSVTRSVKATFSVSVPVKFILTVARSCERYTEPPSGTTLDWTRADVNWTFSAIDWTTTNY